MAKSGFKILYFSLLSKLNIKALLSLNVFLSFTQSTVENPPNLLPFLVLIKERVGPLFEHLLLKASKVSPSFEAVYNKIIDFIFQLIEIHCF